MSEIDPQCQLLIDAINEVGNPFGPDDPVEARRLVDARSPVPDGPEGLKSIEDLEFVDAEGRAIPVRVYRPDNVSETEAPCLIYYHGGGMVFGSMNSHDPICRYLAENTPCVVVSPDYRLAPEHKFPAAFEDAVSVYENCIARAPELGIDARRIAVSGDSAGGNLAAGTSLWLRDKAAVQPVAQFLIYPNVDMKSSGGSIDDYAEGYFLTRDALQRIRDWYMNEASDADDPRASPTHASDFGRLPPALIQVAGLDPLKDEGELYAEKLQAANVPVTLTLYPGVIHGFIRAIGFVDKATVALDEGCDFLRREFEANA